MKRKKQNDFKKTVAVWTSENSIRQQSNRDLCRSKVDHIIASYFSAGDFYYYMIDFHNFEIFNVSPQTKRLMGIEPKDFNFQSMVDILHPEDVNLLELREKKATDFLFNKITPDKVLYYKVCYLMRFRVGGQYRNFLHQGIAVELDENNRIAVALNVHTDITHLGEPNVQGISFLGINGEPSYHYNNLDSDECNEDNSQLEFTSREVDVLHLLAEGLSSKEIASRLHISDETVNVHRKRMLAKTNCKNVTELVVLCLKHRII